MPGHTGFKGCGCVILAGLGTKPPCITFLRNGIRKAFVHCHHVCRQPERVVFKTWIATIICINSPRGYLPDVGGNSDKVVTLIVRCVATWTHIIQLSFQVVNPKPYILGHSLKIVPCDLDQEIVESTFQRLHACSLLRDSTPGFAFEEYGFASVALVVGYAKVALAPIAYNSIAKLKPGFTSFVYYKLYDLGLLVHLLVVKGSCRPSPRPLDLLDLAL